MPAPIFIRGALCVAAFAVIAYIVSAIYDKGRDDANSKWQKKWDDQVAIHEKAITDAKAAENEKEIYWLKEFDKVRDNAQITINRINTDLAGSNESADRLRNQVARLAATASRACTNSGSTERGNAAGAAINMLADMSAGFDEAAREISEFADKSRAAGLTCQAAHAVIKNPH